MSDVNLLEINARVWLPEQPWAGAHPNIADIPDEQIKQWADLGLDWIWMMGVWEPSPRGREICMGHESLRREFKNALPDITDEDIVGSPYAVRGYTLNPLLGFPGDPLKLDSTEEQSAASIPALRKRLNEHGIKLMLDFVPNHTAMDHPWVTEHPEYYIHGTEEDLATQPDHYFKTESGHILAHGRDPYFPAWTDTAQVNYFHPAAINAAQEQILDLARQCDGIRCDMAMLVTSRVIQQTWGDKPFSEEVTQPPEHEFWPSTIERVHRLWPHFTFMAEVYWGMEAELQQMGFDFTYDKKLYDLLIQGRANELRQCLRDELTYQRRSVRFVENHDETRAQREFGERHRAAALVAGVAPGMNLHHEGQWEGRQVKVPVQLGRRTKEQPDETLQQWYYHLIKELHRSPWRAGSLDVKDVREAWEGNPTNNQIIAVYRTAGEDKGLMVANIGTTQAQGYIDFPAGDFMRETIRLEDQVSRAVYEKPRAELKEKGLYLDLPAGQGHLFRLRG